LQDLLEFLGHQVSKVLRVSQAHLVHREQAVFPGDPDPQDRPVHKERQELVVLKEVQERLELEEHKVRLDRLEL